jgi:hypothetical protein
MLPYAVYLDDSGTHDGSPCVCLTGFVANERRWGDLSRRWGTCLDSYGVRYFHAAELERLRGPYRGWTVGKKDAFADSLRTIIEDTLSAPITSSVEMLPYSECVFQEDVRRAVGTPVALAMKGVLLNLAKYAHDVGIEAPIQITLDAGMRHAGELRVMLDRLHADEETRRTYFVGSPNLARVKESYPLQAADLHAYESWKAGCAGLSHTSSDADYEVRIEARKLLAPFGSDGTYDLGFGREGVQNYVEGRMKGDYEI